MVGCTGLGWAAGLGWAGLGWAATGLGWAWLSSRTLKETSKLLKMLEDAVRSEIHAISIYPVPEGLGIMV